MRVELEVVVAVVEAHGLPFLRSVPSTTVAVAVADFEFASRSA
jgi:hypothetical protein